MVTNNQHRHDQPLQLRQVFYGRLESIIDVELPCTPRLNISAGTRYLLALVTPCSTGGKDATRELTTYTETTAQVVIDLRTVECVVGRVRRGNEWGIIDRSGDFARTVFVDTPIIDDEQ